MSNPKEYEFLRNEILSRYNFIQSSMSMMYAAVGVVLAFALGTENKEYFVCLMPLCIIVSLFLHSQEYHKNIASLGAYLYVFHEGEGKDFMWERRHHSEEECDNNKRLSYRWSVPMPYYALIVVCGIVSCMKFLQNKDEKSVILDGVVCITEKIKEHELSVLCCYWLNIITNLTIILSLCTVAFYIIYKNCDDYVIYRSIYIQRWEKVKKREEC